MILGDYDPIRKSSHEKNIALRGFYNPIRESSHDTVFRVIADHSEAYLLGLLAKIKCSICSYQLNLWYLLHGNK